MRLFSIKTFQVPPPGVKPETKMMEKQMRSNHPEVKRPMDLRGAPICGPTLRRSIRFRGEQERQRTSPSRDVRPAQADRRSTGALAVSARVRSCPGKAGTPLLHHKVTSPRAVPSHQKGVGKKGSQPSSKANPKLITCSVRPERPDRAVVGGTRGNPLSEVRGCSVQLERLDEAVVNEIRGIIPSEAYANRRAHLAPTKFTGRIKIMQLNMSYSKVELAEAKQLIGEKKVDVLLLQEPYVVEQPNRGWPITGLGRGVKTAAIRAKRPYAAIAIGNPDFSIIHLAQYSTQHTVCAEIRAPHFSFYVVSQYYQYSKPREEYIDELSRILRRLKGKRVLIGMDANARSKMWGNIRSEDGQLFEDLIRTNDLKVLNDAAQGPTFESLNGSSLIDVTLASPVMRRYVRKWTIQRMWTTGDHYPIEVNLGMPEKERGGRPEGEEVNATRRFNVRKANWETFAASLKEESSSRLKDINLDTAEEVEGMAETLAEVLRKACEDSMPKRKPRRATNPWWSEKLQSSRWHVMRARRDYQRERDPQRRASKVERFKRAMAKYRSDIKAAKWKSWQNFVTQEGNENPWGYNYKDAAGKLKVGTILSTLRDGDKTTISMRETADFLLKTHIPDDDPQDDTPGQQDIREEVLNLSLQTADAGHFTKEDIKIALSTMQNGKAPGCDLVEVQVLKQAFKAVPEIFLTLYNACLDRGVFPSTWKVGSLVTILKGDDKDVQNPKSYRPICLLSVIGKLFEKLVRFPLNKTVLTRDKISSRQYGFLPGKSTEDAIVEMRRLVSTCTDRYAIGLLFDISGAFDNVWWPLVLKALADRDCPKNVFKVLQSYFSDRKVKISWADEEATKQATRGCPQGSVLGPTCWILMFDDLLKSIEERFGEIEVAFADDFLAVITGQSREEVEQKSQEVTDHVVAWCKAAKLKLAKDKTEGIVLKTEYKRQTPMGKKLAKSARKPNTKNAKKKFQLEKRPPQIYVDGEKIKFKTSVRYLGVHFDTYLKVNTHTKKIQEKTGNLFDKMSRLATAQWGLRYRALRTVYRGVFESVATYASGCWSDQCDVFDRRRLGAAQQSALTTVTHAYRTVSRESLCAIAGVTPIELLLEERTARYKIRVGKPAEVGNITVQPQIREEREGVWGERMPEEREVEVENNIDGNNGENLSPVELIKNEVKRLWKVQFNEAETGRITHSFFPDITQRLESKHIYTNYYTTQMLTGHGQFRSYLNKRNLAGESECECGAGEDTVSHLLLECPEYEAQRESISEFIGNRGWPAAAQSLVASKEAYAAFALFSKECLWLKSEHWNAVRERGN